MHSIRYFGTTKSKNTVKPDLDSLRKCPANILIEISNYCQHLDTGFATKSSFGTFQKNQAIIQGENFRGGRSTQIKYSAIMYSILLIKGSIFTILKICLLYRPKRNHG